MFLQKDISQSTPYPGMENVITVTLMANIPLTPETLVTVSNLAGAQGTTVEILTPQLQTPNPKP